MADGVRTGTSTCMKKLMTLVLDGRVAMMCSSSLIADWRMGDEVSAYTYLAAYLHAYISHHGRTLKFDNF